MAVTSKAYSKLADSLATKKANLSSDTIKCMLLASYTENQDAHQFVADVKSAGAEASGTGYTAGGVTLTGVTWSQASGVWALKGTVPAWSTTGGSLTARWAVFYDATPGSDATNPVIAYWNLNGNADVTSSNGTFTLTPATEGIVTFDAV